MKKYICLTKDYFEKYANICLNNLFDYKLDHSERPDLVSLEENMGIEVTQAISKSDAKRNKLFQIRYSSNNWKEEMKAKQAEFGINDVVYGENIAILNKWKEPDDIKDVLENAINKKLIKFKKYRKFNINGLAILCNYFPVSDQIICDWIKTKMKTTAEFSFDIIFVISNNTVLKIDKENAKVFKISNERIIQMKKEALQYSEKQKR